MKISWQILVFTFSTIFLIAAIVVAIESWQENSVVQAPTETPNITVSPSPSAILEVLNEVIVEYRGDGSAISEEYVNYFYFSRCDNDISICNNYLISKNDIGDITFAVGEKVKISGTGQPLGAAAGNHYFELIENVSIEPVVCIQVITPARNPRTGEVKDFPTPCDVPEGWEKL